MELRDLRYFAASAISGNFAQAAGSIGLNSSTLSRRISRLENELGVTLFDRGHFGIRLTAAGRAVMVEVRRALDDLESVIKVGALNGQGRTGKIRLGVRMPPIGEPLRSLLAAWHAIFSDVVLSIYELNDNELQAALVDRSIDVALVTRHALWPDAMSVPIYRERVMAALPVGHPLCSENVVRQKQLRSQAVLTQEWNGSHSAREFYASLLGSGVRFHAHAASKQSVLGLVAAGFGITLVTESQTAIKFPGVVFKPIRGASAWVQVDLAWAPGTEDPAVGRFIAFMRDEAKSWCLSQQTSSSGSCKGSVRCHETRQHRSD